MQYYEMDFEETKLDAASQQNTSISYRNFEDPLLNPNDCSDYFLHYPDAACTEMSVPNLNENFVNILLDISIGEDMPFLDEKNDGSRRTDQEAETFNTSTSDSDLRLHKECEQWNADDRENQNPTESISNTPLSGLAASFSDDQSEDFIIVAASLLSGVAIEAHHADVDEILQSVIEANPAQEQPPPNHIGRKCKPSRRMSECWPTKIKREYKKKRQTSECVTSLDSNKAPDDLPRIEGKMRRRYEEDPSEDPNVEKSRKNAIIAKRNREKKKREMDNMVSLEKALSTRNELLNSDNGKLLNIVQTLEQEVFYLRSVIENQNPLSAVLSSLLNSGLQMSSSFAPKETLITSKSTSNKQPKSSSGVCVHVNANQSINTVSLGICDLCAKF